MTERSAKLMRFLLGFTATGMAGAIALAILVIEFNQWQWMPVAVGVFMLNLAVFTAGTAEGFRRLQ